MNDKVIKAILKINPNAQVSVSADDIDTIVWENGTTPISKADIEAKMAELQTEYDNNKYQRDRAAEYPSIKDQLDDIYHNGIDGWKATIKATKDKYPKG
jgi:biopolymer transport protein ExbD